jgi:diguanylate cyclase (GGDEF)-like protein
MSTFRARILLLLLTIVIVTQVATMLALLVQTNRKGQDLARQELRNAGHVLDALMQTRAEQLRDAVRVLASDYGFKEAVTFGETATVRSALENSAKRIHADVAALLDLDGAVITATDLDLMQGSSSGLRALVATPQGPGPTFRYETLGGVSYLLVLTPVSAPTPVAVAVMGFALDRQLAASLTELLGVQVLFYDIDANAERAIVSHRETPTVASLQRAFVGIGPSMSEPRVINVDDVAYMTWVQPVPAGNGSLRVVLQKPMQEALAPFTELRTVILMVAAIALLIAVPVAHIFARRASRPLDALVEAARRIEVGNYDEPVRLTGVREFSRVAATLDSMRQRIAEREARIRYQATHDALTGLPNRLYAAERIEALLKPATPGSARLGLLLIDIKDFERISASLGQSVSDEVLKEIARRLQHRAGQTMTVARSGVAEFLVAIPDADRSIARNFATQMLESVRSGLIREEVPITLDAHVGLVLCPDHGHNSADLLQRLDSALYDARESNTAIIEYRPGRDEDRRRQFAILGDLRRAAADYGLSLHYQPKVSMQTHQVVSLEALIRWRHPTHGSIAPAEFIPLAERTGNVIMLTSWVLKTAVRQMRDWQAIGFDPDISVNLSAADLLDPELPALVLGHLRRLDVPPGKLVLEITESAIMREIARAVRVMEELRHHGIRFSIDDFGTGYSSLAQFKRLPVDEIKIDKSFVLDLKRDSDDEVIVRSIVDLGHNFGVKVVAEGVETPESWDMLNRLGCDLAQGYLISRPVPGTEIVECVRKLNAGLERATTATQQVRVLRDQQETREPPSGTGVFTGVFKKR